METRAEWDALVTELATRYPDTGPGQMFGMPCLERSGKMAACLLERSLETLPTS